MTLPFNIADSLPIPMEDGHWVNARVNRIIELIREYDSRLDVAWIPPEKRDPRDPAFAVMENLPNGQSVVAFYVQDEDAFDESVLRKIYENDQAKQGDVNARIDAHNKAVRDIQRKAWQDKMEDQADLAKHILKSPKATYRHNGRKYE